MTPKKNHRILQILHHQIKITAKMTAGTTRKRTVTIKQARQRTIEELCGCKSIAPSRNKGRQRDHHQPEGD
jgi:hypothetical protein